VTKLPLEKQFAHSMFCQQIQNIDIDSARKLLADLHLLYLSQQAMFAELIKTDFPKQPFH
jgi:ribosomal protein L20